MRTLEAIQQELSEWGVDEAELKGLNLSTQKDAENLLDSLELFCVKPTHKLHTHAIDIVNNTILPALSTQDRIDNAMLVRIGTIIIGRTLSSVAKNPYEWNALMQDFKRESTRIIEAETERRSWFDKSGGEEPNKSE